MRLKLFPPLSLALSLLTLLHPAFSQTSPAGYSGRSIPITVGAGISVLNIDWGPNEHMLGPTLWINYFPPKLPRMLDGLAVDVEGRDVNYLRPPGIPNNFRYDTATGGPIYYWRHFRDFQVYGKGLIGFGSFDFRAYSTPYYTHETRTVFAPGGGFLIHGYRNVWVRADYEYQFWPDLFTRTLDPQGFTFGAVYDFRGYRR